MVRTTREQVNKLLSRLKNGQDCVKEFIDYTRGYLQYIAYKYLVDKSLIEDAIFLAYDKILNAVKTFDDTKNGLAWIVKIAQNEAYKLNRDEAACDVALEDYKSALADDSTDDNDRMNSYDVERAMAHLSEQEHAIIEYKIYMGMTIREIAELISIPKSTVSYTLKQALKKLKKYLT